MSGTGGQYRANAQRVVREALPAILIPAFFADRGLAYTGNKVSFDSTTAIPTQAGCGRLASWMKARLTGSIVIPYIAQDDGARGPSPNRA